MNAPLLSDMASAEASPESEPPVRVANGPAGDAQLHWTVLGVSAGVLLLALVLQVGDPAQVKVPLLQTPLPDACSYKRLTGHDCPGCGLTRCFISAAHGQWRRAWRFNPAGLYFFALVVGQIPYRAMQLWRLRRGCGEFASQRLAMWTLGSLVIALLAQWLVRTFVA